MKKSVLFLAAAILMAFGLHPCDRGGNNGNYNGGGAGGDTTTVQWVDLGLPSGLLWADRNVGADKPEGYGNYYAWGETSPKERYDWENYAYGSYHSKLIKYCNMSICGRIGFTDTLTILEASDDAASVNLGGQARTPQFHEWQELMRCTTNVWTSRNGIYGRLLTAPNGNSLFLPAAGLRNGASRSRAQKRGFYWSSSLHTEGPYDAWIFYLSSNCQYVGRYGDSRYVGFSVRAVRDGQN